jgi:hypothetical protein
MFERSENIRVWGLAPSTGRCPLTRPASPVDLSPVGRGEEGPVQDCDGSQQARSVWVVVEKFSRMSRGAWGAHDMPPTERYDVFY